MLNNKPKHTLVTPVTITPIKPRGKGFRRLKRLGWAIFMPFFLVFFSGILLLLTGDSNITESINSMLNNIWLPLTLFRLAVYFVLAYLLIPFFIRRAAIKNDYRIQVLTIQHEQSVFVNEQLLLADMIEHAEKQAIAFQKYLQNRHWILFALIGFDVLMVQLPYWLR